MNRFNVSRNVVRNLALSAAGIMGLAFAAPSVEHLSHGFIDLQTSAHAKSEQAGGQGGGKGGRTDSAAAAAGGGSPGGSTGRPADTGRPEGAGSGGTGGAGGAGGGTGGTAILGRLSMARAYLSPMFDPSKIDDPEAPLAKLDAYKTLLELGSIEYDGGTIKDTDKITVEGIDYYYLSFFLSGVATAPVTAASVDRVNEMLSVSLPSSVSADQVATETNALVKLTREE